MPEFAAARDLLERAVLEGEIPGAVAVVGTRDARISLGAFGVRRYLSNQQGLNQQGSNQQSGEAVSEDTRYDLASLTKVVATLSAILNLLSAGKLELETPIGDFFSNAGWFQSPSLAGATVRQLLTHSSGLPAWKPIFALASSRLAAVGNVLQTPLEHPVGEVVYSDLGFILLGLLVERLSGERQDAFVRRELFAPLGMASTGYGPVTNVPVAATEDCGWRNRMLEGEVHDENAFALEGVAGHAGLFGTADDVARYAQAWLRLEPVLGLEDVLREATREQVSCLMNGSRVRRGLGWLLKGDDPFAGRAATPEGFGHTGFTGTSLWLESERNWFAVLLTNRVHPSRTCGQGVHRLRQRFHEAVAAELVG